MPADEKIVLKLNIDEAAFEEYSDVQENSVQTVEFEILPPVDISDIRKSKINKGLSDVDNRLERISARIDELNSEIDTLTNHADGIDYAVSVISGIISGIVDSLFVGETEIDKDKIQEFLEKKYHTANDSGYTHKDPNGNWISSPMYHRLDDLAHHPSIMGLVAAILVRYFRLVCFIDGSDGKSHIFFADTSRPTITSLEKKDQSKAWIGAIIGGLCLWLSNLAIKKYEEINCEEMPEPLKKLIKAVSAAPLMLEIFKAVDVWLGHMMSDVATSQGIPGIFLSLLKEISVLPIIKNTDFRVWIDGLYNKGNMNLSEWGGVVFVAAKKQALPVLINEALVRGFFFVRRLAGELKDKKDFKQVDWKRVIPFKNRTVVRMLTISTSTFTAFDIIDAAIRSGGFNAACILRINFVGIGRFAVAIGTDIGMGIKKKRKEKERSKALSEYIEIAKIKIYYRKADLLCAEAEMNEQEASMHSAEKEIWQEVQYNDEAMQELYEQINRTCQYYLKAMNEMDQCLDSMQSLIPNIEKNNPGLIEKMRESLGGCEIK